MASEAFLWYKKKLQIQSWGKWDLSRYISNRVSEVGVEGRDKDAEEEAYIFFAHLSLVYRSEDPGTFFPKQSTVS